MCSKKAHRAEQQATTRTRPLVARETTSTGRSIKSNGAVVGSRKACVSSRAAERETLICPDQHNTAHPDKLIMLNLNCDKLEEGKKKRGVRRQRPAASTATASATAADAVPEERIKTWPNVHWNVLLPPA